MTGRHRSSGRGRDAAVGSGRGPAHGDVRSTGEPRPSRAHRQVRGSSRGARRHTRAGMAWRQFAADPWVSAALALLVAAVSFLLTAAPRALEDVNGRQLTADVEAMSPLARDVTGRYGTTVEPAMGSRDGEGGEVDLNLWQPFQEGAERLRQSQPEPLRSMLKEAQMVAQVTLDITATPPEDSGYYQAVVTPHADPDLAEHVDLVEGEWPAAGFVFPETRFDDQGQPIEPDPAEQEGPVGLGVVVLKESMDKLQWEVGEQLGSTIYIAGVYEPKDPTDPRWQHIDNSVSLGELFNPDRGVGAQVTAFLSPQSRGLLEQPTSVRMQVWYPVDPTVLVEERLDPAEVRAQLTGMIGRQQVLVEKGNPVLGQMEGDQIPAFTTELTGALDQIARQQRATSSLLAVVGVGPLGVALAVMALASRLVIHRRRPALAMTLARGASPEQVRGLVAIEGLLLGVPAALVGHALARVLWPGSGRWWEWLITAVIALAPAVSLALSLDDASLLQTRRDLSGRSTSRWRWVSELAVVALAALATWRLLDREARGDEAAESGIDLLAAAAPLLLALAACVVALRLYPLPLAALTRMFRSGRGLTPFLGAARALRDPAGGLVPALAVILGTSIALVSAILLSTVTAGAEAAAWDENGADLRVRGPIIREEAVEQLRAVPGVAAVARIDEVGRNTELNLGGEKSTVQPIVVDSELQQVYADSSHLDAPDARLYDTSGPLRIVLGGKAPATLGPADLRGISAQGEVVQHLDSLPGYPTPSAWALVDAAAWETVGRGEPSPRYALVALDPGADQDAVAAEIATILPTAVIGSVEEELADFRTSPVTRGLTTAFVGATVLTGLLTVLAIIVVQLMGSRARAQLLSVLRTLGLAPGQTRALTGWELGPLLVTAMLVGTLLGIAVPWILVRALDLRGLTGGRTQPDLFLDPAAIGIVLGAVVLTVLLAITVSAWLAGRTNLAQALRVGEER